MTFSIFELADDEALVLRFWPMSSNYQSVMLRDMWSSALEYGNRQTSLVPSQSYLDKDGSFWAVISRRDPGIQNWLDTTGLHRGFITFRFDGIGDKPFDPAKNPSVTKVKLDQIPAALPAGTTRFTAEQRSAAIAARRRALQVRCHN